MVERRVTQSDVAKAAKVDPSTVSLALRNHPALPEATRERIQRIAARLGYAPDPMLASLASYRVRLRPAGFHGTLAWLSNWQGWRKVPHFRDYFEGAASRAKHFGFELEDFDLAEEGMTPGRMAAVLRARNVSGILVAPWPCSHAGLEFPWDDFSALTFGYTFASPQLHLVTSSHYHATRKLTSILIRRGYRRIGFALSSSHNERVESNYLAGYYVEAHAAGLEIAPPHDETRSIDAFRQWIAKHRLDAVITGNFGGIERYRELRIPIPGALGIACPSLADGEGAVSGIRERGVHIGEVAVDMLVGMIHRSERGVPAMPQRILVDGDWHEGETLRPSVEKE